MKKRALALFVILLVMTSAVGCGKSEAEPPETEKQGIPYSETVDMTEHYLPAPPDERLQLAVKQNKDTVAWLTIEGTTIDDAVVQSVDNDYYLRRDAQGNYRLEGSYFADHECQFGSSDKLSKNLVIYGHTFQGDEQRQFFAQLHRYTEDEEWALAHRYIKLSVDDVMLTYEIISAGEVDAEADSLAITSTLSVDAFTQVATAAIERSEFDFGVKAAECSQLLTLSTCTGDYASRLLVVARLVSQ